LVEQFKNVTILTCPLRCLWDNLHNLAM
jgi:hypothetical protein